MLTVGAPSTAYQSYKFFSLFAISGLGFDELCVDSIEDILAAQLVEISAWVAQLFTQVTNLFQEHQLFQRI